MVRPGWVPDGHGGSLLAWDLYSRGWFEKEDIWNNRAALVEKTSSQLRIKWKSKWLIVHVLLSIPRQLNDNRPAKVIIGAFKL